MKNIKFIFPAAALFVFFVFIYMINAKKAMAEAVVYNELSSRCDNFEIVAFWHERLWKTRYNYFKMRYEVFVWAEAGSQMQFGKVYYVSNLAENKITGSDLFAQADF